MLIEVVNVVILALLAVTALAAVRLNDLFAVTMMFGIYSLLATIMFVVLDAIDVAFTEAAVGVGISTVLMLGTIGLVGRRARKASHPPILPLIVVIITRWICRALPILRRPSISILGPIFSMNPPIKSGFQMWSPAFWPAIGAMTRLESLRSFLPPASGCSDCLGFEDENVPDMRGAPDE